MYDQNMIKVYNQSTGIIINAINYILRLVLIKLLSSIGEDTKSSVLRSIKGGIFVTQYFNTAFLLLLVNANFSEHHIPFLSEYLHGQYTDFSSDWYKDVGVTIVRTMLISAIFPFVDFGIAWSLRNGIRLLDRSFGKNRFSSKKKSIQQYIDIYSGPEFMVHFRFSTIMNTTFVCLMYGTALPVLFPIGLLAFCVLYFVERLLICYFYKQPPAFDDRITMSSMKVLAWAPVVYMMFSYWFLSN